MILPVNAEACYSLFKPLLFEHAFCIKAYVISIPNMSEQMNVSGEISKLLKD